MVALVLEGFDYQGPAGVLSRAQATGAAVNPTSESPSGATTSGANTIVAGINGYGGGAIQYGNTANGTISFAATHNRLISGCSFSTSTLSSRSGVMCFYNSSSSVFCCTVTVETSGSIAIHTRAADGTLIAQTSGGKVTANTTHWLAWDVTFGSNSAYNIYLDGASVLSGTGNTGNGTTVANSVILGNVGAGTNTVITLDDLYCFDATGTTNNAIVPGKPVIWTDYPTADSSVAFTFGAATIGVLTTTTASTNAAGANFLFIRPVTPSVSCTLASVAGLPQATASGANLKAVLYSDSSGSPGSLLATGNQTTGTTANNTVTSTFSSPPSLTSATKYWIGFIIDTSVAWAETDTGTTGQKIANTYGSGAPSGPLSGMTTGQPNWLIFGNVTGTPSNAYEVSDNPALGNASYVSSNTAGNIDLYTMGNTAPFIFGTISVVQISVNGILASAGTRTINLNMNSSGTTGNGSSAGQTATTSQKWYYSEFPTDPNTSSAWTPTALLAATAGIGIAT